MINGQKNLEQSFKGGIMQVLEKIKGLFGTKGLFDLNVGELENKILAIRVDEDEIIKSLKYIEEKSERLITQLKSSTKDYEKKSIEMDLHNLGRKYKSLEKQLDELISVRNALHNIILIKNRENYLKKHGLWDVILKLDLNKLEWLLVGERLNDEELMLKLNQLINKTEGYVNEPSTVNVGGKIDSNASMEDIKKQLFGK